MPEILEDADIIRQLRTEIRRLREATPNYYPHVPIEQPLSLPETIYELRKALRRVAAWNELSTEFKLDYGSNGERDYYRKIAEEALKL